MLRYILLVTFVACVWAQRRPIDMPDYTSGQSMRPLVPSPNQTQIPVANQNVSASNQTGQGAVHLIAQRTMAGMLETFVARTMLRQCNYRLQPAIDFYTCVENTTQLPTIWAAMGLNATALRIRTLAITTLMNQNVSKARTTEVQIIDVDPDDMTNNLTDLLRNIIAQSDQFCLNTAPLLNCLDSYLTICFPEPNPEGTNMAAGAVPNVNRMSESFAVNNIGPDTNQVHGTNQGGRDNDDDQDADDDEEPDEFFDIPLMYSQNQVSYFARRTLTSLCDRNATGFKLLVNSVPCILQAANVDACQLVDDNVFSVRMLMETMNSTGPNMQYCGAMQSAAACHLDLTFQACGQETAELGRNIYQSYFEAIRCTMPEGTQQRF